MAKGIAWALFFTGVAHIVFGLIRFKLPLTDAVSAGFIGQFKEPELRRTAFWFMMCGPLLMLAGHLAIRAVAAGDVAMLQILGVYALAAAVVGIAAFPVSPLWSLLLLSLLLIGAGRGWL